MDKDLVKLFYLRPEIMSEILYFAKSREIGTRYDGYFGKRPDSIEYLSDIKSFIKKGIMSFHISEERWVNPLLVGNEKLSLTEKSKNCAGWDLILDLDGVDFKYAQIVGNIIINFLTELKIKNVSTKFSGNKGFHIGVPFEAFSKEIIGMGETRLLFPQAPKRIAAYLMHELEDKICEQILKEDKSIKNISKKYNIDEKDLIIKKGDSLKLNFIKLIEIDTILITSRHLFRMPYSFNEKSGLISIPVDNNKILEFQKDFAKPEIVDPKKYINFNFLNYDSKYGTDADILLIKAYEDDYLDEISRQVEISMKNKTNSETIFEINQEVSIKDFPQTISYILNNKFEDGRKRVIFLLLTFLNSIKWDKKVICEIIYEWNSKLETPLKRNYISAQINWFNKQSKEKIISPPNFSNDNYYKLIGIPNEIIEKDKGKFKYKPIVKNPLHYVFLLLKQKSKIKTTKIKK